MGYGKFLKMYLTSVCESVIMAMGDKVEVTKRQLEEWYNTMTVKDLSEKLGFESPNSVYGLLKKAGIPFKGSEKLRRKKGTVKLVFED